MGILNPFIKEFDEKAVHYQSAATKNLLLIFTRNPELGKCKTRLAATIGDESALEIYKFLLRHTAALTKNVTAVKQVWYSDEIWENDIWDNTVFSKKIQKGSDLGVRMANAFMAGFEAGYEKICIIGSDMYDLDQLDIQNAFIALHSNDFVVGPAEDGGYYLLGMNTFKKELFENKNWGESTVLQATLANLKNEKVQLLEVRNDVDVYEDIGEVEAFEPFLKHMKK